jgi:hypothetical protein
MQVLKLYMDLQVYMQAQGLGASEKKKKKIIYNIIMKNSVSANKKTS